MAFGSCITLWSFLWWRHMVCLYSIPIWFPQFQSFLGFLMFPCIWFLELLSFPGCCIFFTSMMLPEVPMVSEVLMAPIPGSWVSIPLFLRVLSSYCSLLFHDWVPVAPKVPIHAKPWPMLSNELPNFPWSSHIQLSRIDDIIVSNQHIYLSISAHFPQQFSANRKCFDRHVT